MNMRRFAVPCAVICVMLAVLSGCGKALPEPEMTAAEEAVSIALACAETVSGNATPESGAESMVDALGSLGYPAVDFAGTLAVRNWEQVEEFCAGSRDELTLVRVCSDGGLVVTKFSAGAVHNVRVQFTGGEPQVTYETEYPLLYLTLTEKGRLIWTEDIPDNTGTAHDGYIEPTTMIRLTPADDVLAALCAKYVAAVGYDDCGLFMSDWSAEDMSAVKFAEAFPALYRARGGTPLTEFDSPYPAEASTG